MWECHFASDCHRSVCVCVCVCLCFCVQGPFVVVALPPFSAFRKLSFRPSPASFLIVQSAALPCYICKGKTEHRLCQLELIATRRPAVVH